MEIKLERLIHVLNEMFGKKIIHASYETKKLHNTGKVQLVTGIAETDSGEKLPYNVILKIQKKERIPETLIYGAESTIYMQRI